MRSAVPIVAKARKCKMLTVLRFEPELRTVQKCRPGARPICISEGFNPTEPSDRRAWNNAYAPDSNIASQYAPNGDGLFFAGLSDGDVYTDFEIGLEAVERAQDFLLQSEKMLGSVILNCSVQRNDPFLPVMLHGADVILLPIVPNVEAVDWYGSIQPMLSDAGTISRAIPIAVMPMPFHLTGEIKKQLGIRVATEFRFFRNVAQAHDEY